MTGIGVGGEYTAIFAAIDEFIPALYRGRVDIILDGCWYFGSILASLISLIFYNFFPIGNITWKFLFIFGVLGAFPIIFLRRKIPESARWYLIKNKIKEALEVVNYVEQ